MNTISPITLTQHFQLNNKMKSAMKFINLTIIFCRRRFISLCIDEAFDKIKDKRKQTDYTHSKLN